MKPSCVAKNYFTYPFASFSDLPGFKLSNQIQSHVFPNYFFSGLKRNSPKATFPERSTLSCAKGKNTLKTPFLDIRVHYGYEILVQIPMVI